MLTIRLTRTGKRHEAHYRIIVTEKRSKRDGKIVEQIGQWHPKQADLKLDKTKFEDWVKKGARPSATVRQLYVRSS